MRITGKPQRRSGQEQDQEQEQEQDLSKKKINFLLGDVDAMFREFMRAQSSSDAKAGVQLTAEPDIARTLCMPAQPQSQESDVSCASTVRSPLSSNQSCVHSTFVKNGFSAFVTNDDCRTTVGNCSDMRSAVWSRTTCLPRHCIECCDGFDTISLINTPKTYSQAVTAKPKTYAQAVSASLLTC